MKKINERLFEERTRLGLKKGKMAAAGNVANSTYTNYEEGKRSPDGDFLSAIAIAGADVQYILTGVRANAIIQQPPQTVDVDIDRLTLAIETVEEGLEKTKRMMKPDKKALLIMAVYDLFEEPTPTAKQSVLRLVQSAA